MPKTFDFTLAWKATMWTVATSLDPSPSTLNLMSHSGQNDVDGGGFKTFKTTEDYIWTQFESAKRNPAKP